MNLSFCTTCMGRLHHLRKTLPENLQLVDRLDGVNIVLINYSSPDGIDDWVRSEMGKYVDRGKLEYYRVSGYKLFHMSHAKNLSHLLGGGIVCNLDADNFIGDGFPEYLLERFQERGVFTKSPSCRGGLAGKIAFRKEDFVALGGYDEAMKSGWGYEDVDLRRRASATGLRQVTFPKNAGWLRAIDHSTEERTALCPTKSHKESDYRHGVMSRENRARGRLVANRGVRWGYCPTLERVACTGTVRHSISE